VAWTEAHHIRHWADGGVTAAENLILLCRFHHGRIHTTGWSVEKTGPGQAVITHHDGHEPALSAPGSNSGCGCSDWRTDHDMDTEHQGSDWDVFPTGLYRTEWSETMKPELDGMAEAIDRDRAIEAMRAAKARCRAKFATPQPPTPAPSPVPVLGCPSRQTAGGEAPQRNTTQRSSNLLLRFGPLGMPKARNRPQPTPSHRCPPEPRTTRTGKPETGQSPAPALSSPPG
jgi:hypothetical protein